MNTIIHDTQITLKQSPRKIDTVFDSRPRFSQGSSRPSRVLSFNMTKRTNPTIKKHLNLELNSTKDSITPLNITRAMNQSFKSSRPLTATNSNKQRLQTAKSNERYRITLMMPEEQPQPIFGPTVKKIYTPLNNRATAFSTKIFIDPPSTERTQNSINNYIVGKDIGKGAYATVKYGVNKLTNKKVAIKIYDKVKFNETHRMKNAYREIQILQKLNNNSILKLYEYIETESYLYLILELVQGCSFNDYAKRQPDKRLAEPEACRLFLQLIQALDYCHSNNVTHRDIKFDNILLDGSNNIKLIDFGFSTISSPDQRTKIFCGTPSYMAPEIILKNEYLGPPVDIWASGIVLFGLLCGYFPFKSQCDKDCYKKILSGLVYIPSFVASEPRDIIEKLLVLEPSKRLTAKEILKHRWFEKFTQSKDNAQVILTEPKIKINDPICEHLKKLGYTEEYIKSQMIDQKSHISLLYNQIKKNKMSLTVIKRNYSNVR